MWLLVTIQDSTDAEVEINNPKTQWEALHQGPTQSRKTSDTERLTMPEGQGEEMVASKWPERMRKSLSLLMHCAFGVEGRKWAGGVSWAKGNDLCKVMAAWRNKSYQGMLEHSIQAESLSPCLWWLHMTSQVTRFQIMRHKWKFTRDFWDSFCSLDIEGSPFLPWCFLLCSAWNWRGSQRQRIPRRGSRRTEAAKLEGVTTAPRGQLCSIIIWTSHQVRTILHWSISVWAGRHNL